MSKGLFRLIAFYLPQFYPIPENDTWWGKGFTEWTNVARAQPLFPGHYQPHIPADLGFYDLRLPETRQAQADLAREYGIFGFCYYHYWFAGRRLLERPFNEVLASGEPDFPFCLCWANHNWTRRWDGSNDEVLMAQSYSAEDDKRHIQWLSGAFKDKRYIRIDGKPLFLVHRAKALPNPIRTTTLWREEAFRLGIGEIFLARVESGEEYEDPTGLGFDVAVEFQPDGRQAGARLQMGKPASTLARKIGIGYQAYDFRFIYQDNDIYDYRTLVENSLKSERANYNRIRCVTPGWDNTARRKSERSIFKHSSPALYEEWLRQTLRATAADESRLNIVFINAWNEWAEGNHLEPCQRWGRAYLEATRKALDSIES
jgi:lipopolysaccharide biosynthesis protein